MKLNLSFVGPWLFGEFAPWHIAFWFVFELYVEGVLIPGMFTYVYGFFQVSDANWYRICVLSASNKDTIQLIFVDYSQITHLWT